MDRKTTVQYRFESPESMGFGGKEKPKSYSDDNSGRNVGIQYSYQDGRSVSLF